MTHLFDRSQWWRGAVEERAKRWAEHVFQRTKGRRPWPPLAGVMTLKAREAIVDLLSLTPVGDEMVRTAYEIARAHYETLQAK
jgi:hypothetical protein